MPNHIAADWLYARLVDLLLVHLEQGAFISQFRRGNLGWFSRLDLELVFDRDDRVCRLLRHTLPVACFLYVTIRGMSVSIIGLGNWGTSLAIGLEAAGIPIREIIVRKKVRRTSLPTVTWLQAALDAKILWLCVPDAAIEQTALAIVQRRPSLKGQIVLHSSGALTVKALEAARKVGAQIASVHPAMTFPTREAVSLRGVLFGIEASEAGALRTLRVLVRKLGGKPFVLDSKKKALYHAAGTFASPLLVSALTAAMETAQFAGLDEETAHQWVRALAAKTASNVFEQGAQKSFSGPFARGDAETIHLHLQALQPHPILAELYRALARHAIETLPVRNTASLHEVLSRKTQSHEKLKRQTSRRE
jgi:predicted short-subunit dehydrogenase-like oxidoreductase (DUF2520 family)